MHHFAIQIKQKNSTYVNYIEHIFTRFDYCGIVQLSGSIHRFEDMCRFPVVYEFGSKHLHFVDSQFEQFNPGQRVVPACPAQREITLDKG